MPTTGALFGNAVAGPGSTHGAKHLVEMRAGRMNLKGKMVYPDKRKGLLYVYQSDDSLMHFCWKDRTTGVVEDDLIIFPDDCEYIRVPQCTTGRVYLLKFKSSTRRFFFWLQEPRTDRDDESCKKINEYLNNPPGPGNAANSSVSGGTGGLAGADQDLQSLLNNMSQSQLMQLFGGVGQIGGLSSLLGTMSRPSTGGNSRATATTPSMPRYSTAAAATTPTTNSATSSVGSTTPTTTTQASNPSSLSAVTNAPKPGPRTTATGANPSARTAGNPIQLADLQNLLQGITPAVEQQQVDLSSAMTTDALSGILNDSEALSHLQEHLPAVGGSNQDQLRSTLQSPQFQQALSMFSSALQSGQLAPVVEQLSVNPEAVVAASQGDMQGFVQALERGSEQSESSDTKVESKSVEKPGNKPAEDDDDDEGMQLG